MDKTWTVWRGVGLAAIVIFLSALFWWLIQYYANDLGADSLFKRVVYFVLAWGITLILFNAKSIHWAVKERWHRLQAKNKNELPADESRVAQTPPRNVIVSEIREAMRSLYSFNWSRKIRILLITGTPDEVEQLTPGLTSQYWQEDCGTLLLWGGDLNTPADNQWLVALRKLRRRPVDGVVWVTSAFDRLSAPGAQKARNVPSPAEMEVYSHAISTINNALGWRLPLYVWSLHPRAGKQEGRVIQTTACMVPAGCTAKVLADRLHAFAPELISQGTRQTCGDPQHNFLLNLADRLIREPQSLTGPLAVLLNPYRPLSFAGVTFSQVSAGAERRLSHRWGKDARWDGLLESVAKLPAGLRARKHGFSWARATVLAFAGLMIFWGIGMAVSFISNRAMIHEGQGLARQAADAIKPQQSRLQSLLALQLLIEKLQHRQEQGVPWYARFGLSQNNELLASLWPQYEGSAIPLLRDAAAAELAVYLNTLKSLPPDNPRRETMIKPAYERLKLYLMLARPEKMEAAWFTQNLLKNWPKRDGVKEGYWQGSGPSLLHFYAVNLPQHAGWKLPADDGLIEGLRVILVRQMGVRNGESSLYQKMLSQVAHQYADLRLQDMVGDTDAALLFTTDEVVPGMFTRQAWDDSVQKAIEKIAGEQREEMDWVLSDSKAALDPNLDSEALKARLTARYFSDFSGSWLNFLNSLQWVRAATLSDAADQLTLMADVRQSPLVALMNTLSVQGRTGQTGEGLSDSLVKSAQNLFNKNNQPAIDQSKGAHGPLDASFGPLLALIDGSAGGQGNTNLSLQTFLTRITQVRLKLQQVINASDPQAMTQVLAQTVFQGKAVDLTETRDYGSLIAAGLGQEWSGFGLTVFVQPMEQAWQQVLAPAADSLNAQWQRTVVSDWNNIFGGRYPFSASSSEASLPLLAKYLNSDTGRIAQFLQTRLQGVIHREGSRWVPDSINSQGLTFNPEFLKAMNTLSHISDVVFTQGNAGLNFELRPGTAAGVMQTDISIDSQKLSYSNQMPQWKRFTWPADTEAPGANLSWVSTQAGMRQYEDMTGSWGWIRLLDKATVSEYPGVGSSYRLSWKAQDGSRLNYTLRTEAAEGPLALLKLRNFRLPDKIFVVGSSLSQSALTGMDDATAQEAY